jgi:hypothetical protein
LTIIFSGMMAATPGQGGATWAVLNYLLGFKRLGHEVFFVEPAPAQLLQPAGATLKLCENAAYFRQVVAEFGLAQTSALLAAGTRETVGCEYRQLVAAARRADVIFNVAGMLVDAELLGPPPVRVYLDLDPAFTQLWQSAEGLDMRMEGHTHFVTVGCSIGTDNCKVPTCGRRWIHTLAPVMLEQWPAADAAPLRGLTTVGNWRAYGNVELEGVKLGQKVHSMRRFYGLPRLCGQTIELAMAIAPAEANDLAALHQNGWTITDPAAVAATPRAYRSYIRESKGEFGVAKSGYADSSCGWFSDRSACYLASGRPVIAQETGFSRVLPTGRGLFAVSNVEQAAAAIQSLDRDYMGHAREARLLAEEHFDSDKVLRRLLDLVSSCP